MSSEIQNEAVAALKMLGFTTHASQKWYKILKMSPTDIDVIKQL